MSFEIEGQSSQCLPNEMTDESQKTSKIISYTTEFLLSLSGLDICKKLPSGFDQSIISEFEDSSHDQQRISGGASLNSFRRTDYGLSPPTRGDSTSYSWGNHGRWESHSSSGRNDRDSDSQTNWDSDSGRRFDNQSRHSQQRPEHDGLLGSGSFLKPSEFAAGVSTPKVRPNDQYQLNKTNEPYHPPRPYKAPHSRRGTHDSYNDETFGFSEYTNEDRVEEERKRRESFELMRKEQQKTFQEKLKFDIERKKDEFDITTLREDSKDSKRTHTSNVLDEPAAPPASDTSSEKSYFPSQMPATRPVVPPGFTSTIVDRNLGAKYLNHHHAVVAGESEVSVHLSSLKNISVLHETSDNQEKTQLADQMGLSKQQDGNTSSHASINDHSGKVLLDVSNEMIGGKSIFYNRSDLSNASKDSETAEPNVAQVTGNSILGKSNEDSASLLDKLFGSPLALTGGGSSTPFEHQDSKSDETWRPHTVRSSKFSPWFHREEKKPSNDLSSGKPNDLLSLIVGGKKDGSQVSQINENILAKFPLQSSDSDENLVPNVMPAPLGKAEHLYTNIRPEAVPAVLTCEDVEQTILSEIGDSGSVMQPSVQSLTDPCGKKELPKASVDDSMSQHLLSLLQKGTCLRDLGSSQKLDAVSSGNLHEGKGTSNGTTFYEAKDANAEKLADSTNLLTLETLFGTAFMKELQSVGEPVSVQRAPSESLRVDVADAEPHQLGIPAVKNALHSSNGIEFNVGISDTSVSKANSRMHIKTDRTEEQWLNFDVPSVGPSTSHLRSNQGSEVGFDVPANIRLPEVDSLISVSDPLSAQNFVASRSSVRTEFLSSQTAQSDMALGSILKNGRPVKGQEQSFLPGSFDSGEPDLSYQNFNVQTSSVEFYHHQMHNMGPLHPLDSQMKFMAPEAVLQHDPRPNYQFSPNIVRPSFPHSSTGLSGFDQPVHHPVLQRMHMPGNLPPHLLPGMSRGPSPSHPNRGAAHPNRQVAGFMQDVNPVPGLPFGHQQPNFGSIGMAQPAPDVGSGSNNPEAFQRLIEMELRANAKTDSPFGYW